MSWSSETVRSPITPKPYQPTQNEQDKPETDRVLAQVAAILGNPEEKTQIIWTLPSPDVIKKSSATFLKNEGYFFRLFCYELAKQDVQGPIELKTVNNPQLKVSIKGPKDKVDLLKAIVENWRAFFLKKEDVEIVVLRKNYHFFLREKQEVISLQNEVTESGCPEEIFQKVKALPAVKTLANSLGAECQIIEEIRQSCLLFQHETEPYTEKLSSVQISWKTTLP